MKELLEKGRVGRTQKRYNMLIGILIIGYLLGILLLLRFFQMVHHCDEEIETMANNPAQKLDEGFRRVA